MQVTDVFEDIHETLLSDQLSLPSLPDMALQIHRAAGDPNCTFASIGRVLRHDPAVSGQLIRMANSPLYRGRVPTSNLRAAVHRIGVPGVRNFVTSIALRNLFSSSNKALSQLFTRIWEESTAISALTAVLATSCAGFDPDDALLAGLMQNIGAVTLLGQLSDRDVELPDNQVMTDAIDRWAPDTGARVLQHWGFDKRYIDIARARHDWHHATADGLQLIDLVTISRLHHYIASGNGAHFPALDTIPAIERFPTRQLGSSGGLLLLDNSESEVSQIRAALRH